MAAASAATTVAGNDNESIENSGSMSNLTSVSVAAAQGYVLRKMSNASGGGVALSVASPKYEDRSGYVYGDYTLADVYDDAAIIGSELEKIITNYGSDVLKDLMPKVINVLELLENLTIKNEKENDEIGELRARITSLEFEKAQRINEREKFEKVIFFFSFQF
jgi:hypothetical protein